MRQSTVHTYSSEGNVLTHDKRVNALAEELEGKGWEVVSMNTTWGGLYNVAGERCKGFVMYTVIVYKSAKKVRRGA